MLRPRDTLYPQKSTLTSPTSRGRSVGIVRLWTKATEFFNVKGGGVYSDRCGVRDLSIYS
jgi:hypothetical protein